MSRLAPRDGLRYALLGPLVLAVTVVIQLFRWEKIEGVSWLLFLAYVGLLILGMLLVAATLLFVFALATLPGKKFLRVAAGILLVGVVFIAVLWTPNLVFDMPRLRAAGYPAKAFDMIGAFFAASVMLNPLIWSFIPMLRQRYGLDEESPAPNGTAETSG